MSFEEFIVDFGLPASYVLLGLGVVGVIVFPLIQGISNPSTLLRPVIGLVVVAILFFISLALGGEGRVNDVMVVLTEEEQVQVISQYPEIETAMEDGKMVSSLSDDARGALGFETSVFNTTGAMMIATYLLLAVAVIAIFYTEIVRFIR